MNSSNTFVHTNDCTGGGMKVVGVHEIIDEERDEAEAAETNPRQEETEQTSNDPCQQARSKVHNCSKL